VCSASRIQHSAYWSAAVIPGLTRSGIRNIRLTAGQDMTAESGSVPRGRLPPAMPSLQPTKVTLFTMIFYDAENSIRDVRPFCRSLFCHSSVVTYTSSLLQQRTRNETWLPNIAEIVPSLALLTGPAPEQNKPRNATVDRASTSANLTLKKPLTSTVGFLTFLRRRGQKNKSLRNAFTEYKGHV